MEGASSILEHPTKGGMGPQADYSDIRQNAAGVGSLREDDSQNKIHFLSGGLNTNTIRKDLGYGGGGVGLSADPGGINNISSINRDEEMKDGFIEGYGNGG